MNVYKRNLYIDILKVVCIIMVITSHTTTFHITIDSIAVPIFLVIAGFNSSNSIETHQTSFTQYYKIRNIIKKIMRFAIPFLVLLGVEFIILLINNQLSGISIIKLLLLGGFGDGSYYTPLLMQIIFVFPLIHFLIKKHKAYIFMFLFITLIFEIIINLVFSPSTFISQFYRMSIFRQLFYIASGSYIFFYSGKTENILSVALIVIGSIFYTLLALNLYQPIIFKMWIGTTLPFGCLAIGTVYLLLKLQNPTKPIKFIEYFANATYHIFLTQQLYYWTHKTYYNFPLYSIQFNLIMCCGFGIIFYLIERQIKKHTGNRKHLIK